MYIRKCAVCGKRFPTSSRNKTICSEKCREQRKKEREEFATVHNTQKYCSKECQQKSHKYISLGHRTFTCEFCGNSFEADAKRRFCTKECRENAVKAGKMRRKPKKPKLSIAKINELARKEGLNYGQYVAKHGL